MMFRRMMLNGLSLVVLSTACFAQAADHGTAEEARAMLEKAIAAVRADKDQALATFNKGEGGAIDRDLYLFCANASDGTETVHPTHRRVNLAEVKDVNGVAFGKQILETAKDGEIGEVTYMWPRPGSDAPVEKVSFFTKAGDQICGVGYYK